MKEKTLETLNDIVQWTCKCGCVTFKGETCQRCKKLKDKFGDIDFEDLKALAIKWVKKDKEVINRLHIDDRHTWIILLQRWMKRLNISEEDLC